MHDRVLYRMQDPSPIVPGKECRVRTECPNPLLPEDIKRPKITILSLTLDSASEELSIVESNNLKFFRAEEPLSKHGLVLGFRELNVHAVSVSSFISEPSDSFRFRCLKLPYDPDARIGVHRILSNPDKIEKIFGYNAVITASIEPQWGIELPTGCITIAGNAGEGKQFISLQEQLRRFHSASPWIHLLDAKYEYDELHNFLFS